MTDMTDKVEKGFFDRLWDQFASVKLAVVLFAVIALTSIVGTVIEQNAEPQKNLTIIAKFVGESNAPSVYGILDAMGFMDMYRSWWFVALLMLFAMNLIVCSWDRIPPVWKASREKIKPLKDDQFAVFPIKRETVVKASPADARQAIEAGIRKLGFNDIHAEEDSSGGYQLYADRHASARLGVYITHLSILVILIGAVAGVFLGFKGYVNLPEGARYPMAFGYARLSDAEYEERENILRVFVAAEGDMAKTASSFGVTPDHLRDRMKRLGVEPLPFAVMCNDFEVKFYGLSDMPKEYTSQLVVFENGKALFDKWIEVNDPLKYKGYTFYQSSYGSYGETKDYVFVLKVTAPGGSPTEVRVHMGESFTVPGTKTVIKLDDFSPALRNDASGRVYTYSEMMNNPAVRLEVMDGPSTYARWVLKRYPNTWALAGGITVEFADALGAQYTGLQVRRDPGVWIVYLGCLIMSVGLYMTFFMSHRRIWVRATSAGAGKGNTRLTAAATAHKHREGFERQVNEFVARLTDGGKGK